MDDDGNHSAFSHSGGRRDRLPSPGTLSPLANAYRGSREHSGTITSRRVHVSDVELLAYQLRLTVREIEQAIRLGLITWPKR
jgi:hypothetical protein